MSTRTTFADDKDTYEAALRSLFHGKPEDAEADLSRLCTSTFVQRDNSTTRNFSEFVVHIRWVRENLKDQVQLTVVQFLCDGLQRADRHTSETRKPDGTVLRAETFMFVELAEDGRFDRITEAVQRR